MVSLLDIAPLTETVTVRGVSVSVTGVSARGVAVLLSRFPELQALFGGTELETNRLFDFGGEAVAAIIAAGCGTPGDAAAEAIADKLGIDDQAEILGAIVKMTFPRGISPFVEKLARMGQQLSGETSAEATKEPRTTSRKPSKG